MADKVTYSISVTPQEELAEENGGSTFIVASEVGKGLGGSGVAVVTNYTHTAASQGYKDAAVNYHECTDGNDTTAPSTETSASFIFYKNTGYTFSSATALGVKLDKAVKVMCNTTVISVLDPGECLILKDDNRGINASDIHCRTVDLDGGNNATAGHLAVEYLVVD